MPKSEIPKVIPPLSVVRLMRSDQLTPCWKERVGLQYRIGYYSPQDGLSVIWLVDNDGNYTETTDRSFLLKYFKIEYLSSEEDYFGENAEIIQPIKSLDEYIKDNKR